MKQITSDTLRIIWESAGNEGLLQKRLHDELGFDWDDVESPDAFYDHLGTCVFCRIREQERLDMIEKQKKEQEDFVLSVAEKVAEIMNADKKKANRCPF